MEEEAQTCFSTSVMLKLPKTSQHISAEGEVGLAGSLGLFILKKNKLFIYFILFYIEKSGSNNHLWGCA